MLQSCNVANLQCCNIATLQSCKVTMLQSYSVAMLQYCKVAMLQCFNVALLQSCNVVKLQCCNSNITSKQAGAELCQAQLSQMLQLKLQSKLALEVANDIIIQIQEMHQIGPSFHYFCSGWVVGELESNATLSFQLSCS